MKKNSSISDDVLKKIKQITIKTKRLLRGSLVGDSRSALKGTGFEFDQIREYQIGDDVRFIDWKASSRMNELLIKQYIEERSRTILLAVDISASESFGSQDTLKREVMAEVASVLTLVATIGKDRVGLLLFSDKIERYIPPNRGQNHAFTIMKELFSYQAESTQTNMSVALKKLAEYKQRDLVAFIISDFIDTTSIDPTLLSMISRKKDLYALRCLDQQEMMLDTIGFLPIQDSETGEQITLDLRAKKNNKLRSFLTDRITEQDNLFKRNGVSILNIANNNTFIGDLIRFFRRRMNY